MDRRTFIEKSAIGTAALTTSFYLPGMAQNRKIKACLIGSGWYGMVITKAALKAGGVEIIGVCDVDAKHLDESVDELEKLQGKRPKAFGNYEALLDMNGLEAVFIGTPPHWHALQFIAACEKGLDIYCEKPLSYDVKEGQAMVEAAQKAGNIVQVGFQRRQSTSYDKVQEYIGSGKAGTVKHILAQIHYKPNSMDTTIQEPPASLDWDEWCGPAPKLDYRPSIGHIKWRLEKAYGNGHLVDWGIHHIDIIRRIMNLSMPEQFQSVGGNYHHKDQFTTPDTLNAIMQFENTTLEWQHRMWGTGDFNPEYNNGIYFYGDKATVFVNDKMMQVMPADKEAERIDFEIEGKDVQVNHMAEFLDAIRQKDKNKISCTVEDAFASTATVQLATIAYDTALIVNWDESQKAIINNKDASGLLKREYRTGWKHPG